MIRLLTVALAIALAASTQQTATGEIGGRVIGPKGDGLPGVRVTVQAEGQPISKTIETAIDGRFRFEQVSTGVHYLTFYLRGFNYVTSDPITVNGGSRRDVNVTLNVEPTHKYADDIVALSPEDDPKGYARAGEVAVQVDTSAGLFYLGIDIRHAPITSANFLKYVDAHLYDGGQFHRATRPENYSVILPNRPMMNLIQGGINPSKRAEGFPAIPLERTNVTGLKHVAGTVSMARGTVDSATSDFFILLDDQPSLDFGGKRFDDGQGAAAFGRVIILMGAVRQIQLQPVTGQNLTPPIEIRSISRVK